MALCGDGVSLLYLNTVGGGIISYPHSSKTEKKRVKAFSIPLWGFIYQPLRNYFLMLNTAFDQPCRS